MTKIASVFKQMRDSIKNDAKAVADVAHDALDGAADFHTDADNKPVKDQKWAKEVEGKT
jgi:hypothetical protein